MPVMPAWAMALMIAMQLEPAVAQAINLATLPALTPEQFAQMQASRNQSIANYEAAIGARPATNPTSQTTA